MRYVRAAALFGALGFSIFAAGCSGSGGATPPVSMQGTGSGNPLALAPTSSAPTTETAVSAQSTAASPALSAFEVDGPIVAVSAGRFEVKSSKVGYLNVYTNSSTKTWGTPKDGSYAIATGVGSGGTSEKAGFVMISASAPEQISLTGTITSTQPYGVAVKLDSTGKYIPVALSSMTRVTGTMAPGLHVSVSGLGSEAGLVASAIASGTHAQSSAAISPSVTSSAVTSPINAYEVDGSITTASPSGFTIHSSKAGYLHVYVNSSAKTWGQPRAGYYAVATGSGSAGTSEHATFLMVSAIAPRQLSVRGYVTSVQPYGVAVKLDSTGRYIPVAFSSLTRISGSISPGAHVSIIGIGSISGLAATTISNGSLPESTASTPTVSAPAISAPSVSTPSISGGVPRHLITSDYLMGAYGTHSVSPGRAAPYLTWAQTSIADSQTIANAGIKVQFYTDPLWLDPTLSMDQGLPESAYAHTCSGQRVIARQDGGFYYVSNPFSSAMQQRFSSYIDSMERSGHIDMLWEDAAGPLSAYSQYPNGKPCGYTNALWDAATIAINNSVNRHVMVNGGNNYSGTSLLTGTLLTLKGNTTAINIEHCYSDSTPIMHGTGWLNMENEEITATNQGHIVECMSRDLYSASSQIPARVWTLASFLLGYNINLSILAEEFATPSGLHVMPESQLVVLNPVQSQPATIAGLRTSTGIYGRQYRNCYLKGVSVGPCAVAVSNDGASERFPFSGYHHTLKISGNGVLDGGTVSTYGAAPPTYMAPYTAVIAFN